MEIAELLAFGVKNKASDLHLSAGLPPMIRVHRSIGGSARTFFVAQCENFAAIGSDGDGVFPLSRQFVVLGHHGP